MSPARSRGPTQRSITASLVVPGAGAKQLSAAAPSTGKRLRWRQMLARRRCLSRQVFLLSCTSSIHLQSPGLFSNTVGSRWQGQMGGRGTLLRITQINMRKVIKPTAPSLVWGEWVRGWGGCCGTGSWGEGPLERPRMGLIHPKICWALRSVGSRGCRCPSRETWHLQA